MSSAGGSTSTSTSTSEPEKSAFYTYPVRSIAGDIAAPKSRTASNEELLSYYNQFTGNEFTSLAAINADVLAAFTSFVNTCGLEAAEWEPTLVFVRDFSAAKNATDYATLMKYFSTLNDDLDVLFKKVNVDHLGSTVYSYLTVLLSFNGASVPSSGFNTAEIQKVEELFGTDFPAIKEYFEPMIAYNKALEEGQSSSAVLQNLSLTANDFVVFLRYFKEIYTQSRTLLSADEINYYLYFGILGVSPKFKDPADSTLLETYRATFAKEMVSHVNHLGSLVGTLHFDEASGLLLSPLAKSFLKTIFNSLYGAESSSSYGTAVCDEEKTLPSNTLDSLLKPLAFADFESLRHVVYNFLSKLSDETVANWHNLTSDGATDSFLSTLFEDIPAAELTSIEDFFAGFSMNVRDYYAQIVALFISTGESKDSSATFSLLMPLFSSLASHALADKSFPTDYVTFSEENSFSLGHVWSEEDFMVIAQGNEEIFEAQKDDGGVSLKFKGAQNAPTNAYGPQTGVFTFSDGTADYHYSLDYEIAPDSIYLSRVSTSEGFYVRSDDDSHHLYAPTGTTLETLQEGKAVSFGAYKENQEVSFGILGLKMVDEKQGYLLLSAEVGEKTYYVYVQLHYYSESDITTTAVVPSYVVALQGLDQAVTVREITTLAGYGQIGEKSNFSVTLANDLHLDLTQTGVTQVHTTYNDVSLSFQLRVVAPSECVYRLDSGEANYLVGEAFSAADFRMALAYELVDEGEKSYFYSTYIDFEYASSNQANTEGLVFDSSVAGMAKKGSFTTPTSKHTYEFTYNVYDPSAEGNTLIDKCFFQTGLSFLVGDPLPSFDGFVERQLVENGTPEGGKETILLLRTIFFNPEQVQNLVMSTETAGKDLTGSFTLSNDPLGKTFTFTYNVYDSSELTVTYDVGFYRGNNIFLLNESFTPAQGGVIQSKKTAPDGTTLGEVTRKDFTADQVETLTIDTNQVGVDFTGTLKLVDDATLYTFHYSVVAPEKVSVISVSCAEEGSVYLLNETFNPGTITVEFLTNWGLFFSVSLAADDPNLILISAPTNAAGSALQAEYSVFGMKVSLSYNVYAPADVLDHQFDVKIPEVFQLNEDFHFAEDSTPTLQLIMNDGMPKVVDLTVDKISDLVFDSSTVSETTREGSFTYFGCSYSFTYSVISSAIQ